MGRIGESLSKLHLNSNVTSKPFKNMKAKEIIELCYHLAEVYDAEALFPETAVKKKLKVFKNFARVHSLIHLVPPVKDMKPKKCIRLVTSLLDTLEEKYGDKLYTRNSWPVACKQLPKMEVTVSGGGYNLENLNLDPNAVPPGVTKLDASPGTKKFESSSGNNLDESVLPDAISIKCSNFSEKPEQRSISSSAKPIHFENTTSSVTLKGDIATTPPCLNAKEAEFKNASMKVVGSNVNTTKQKDEMAMFEQPSNSSNININRSLESLSSTPGSKETLKSQNSVPPQVTKAVEELAKVGAIVEVVGWSKAIYTNNRVWQAIRNVIFSRLLLGMELRKYQAKKIVPDEKILTTCGVTIEEKVSEEDAEILKFKLSKLMAQISKLVPDNLLEDLKSAVKTSCQNATLRIRESDDFL